MTYVLAFLGMMLTDWLWASYILRASERRHIAASAYSAAIVLVSAAVTILYVSDWRVIPAACGGAFVGTLLAVRRG